MKKVCISIIAGLALTGQAAAGYNDFFNQGYVGLSYAALEQDDRFFGEDRLETGELLIRLVGNINEYFSSELRVGATVDDNKDTLADDQTEAEFRHNYLASGFLRLGYPLFANFTPYVAAGYTWGEERLEAEGASTSRSTFDDWSFAAGIDIDLGERLGLNIEATEYYNIGSVALRGPSAGLYWRF